MEYIFEKIWYMVQCSYMYLFQLKDHKILSLQYIMPSLVSEILHEIDLVNSDTDGAIIEGVRINRVWVIGENVWAFFPQGQSKVSVKGVFVKQGSTVNILLLPDCPLQKATITLSYSNRLFQLLK